MFFKISFKWNEGRAIPNFKIKFIPNQWTLSFDIIFGEFGISLVDVEVIRLSSIAVLEIRFGREMIIW